MKLAYNFVSPMALMIWAAIVIEGIMLDWADVGVLLALLGRDGELLQAAAAELWRRLAALREKGDARQQQLLAREEEMGAGGTAVYGTGTYGVDAF